MKNNEIIIHMQKGHTSVTGGLYQYDYGQRLIINGVALPNTYEVHFSNEQYGSSKTVLGDSTGVAIPDEYLTSGNSIHVWVYLHDGDEDGETEYHGIINVIRRAKPTDQEPTPVQQNVITQAIAALNTGVSTVESIAGEVQEIADGIPQTINVALQDAKDSGEFDGPKGDKGEKGDTGEQGPKGDKGEPGEIPQETLDQIENDIADLKSNKADVIISSASGSIASFPDGAEAPVKSLSVAIEPVQDLHGYDTPWPEGGGVNKLDANYTETFTTSKDFSISIPSGTQVWVYRDSFTYTTEPSSGAKRPHAVFYNGSTVVGSVWVNPDGKISQVTLTGDATIIRIFANGLDWTASQGVEVTIKGLEVSYTKPAAWTPYSNICPITGWTGAKVTRTGKNLLPSINETRTINGITWTKNADGSVTLDGTATANSVYDFGRGSLTLKAGTYTTKEQSSGGILLTVFHVVNGSASVLLSGGGTFTLTQDESIFLRYFVASGKTVSKTIYPQIEIGSTATAYEPYQGETYDIEFPSEAGTVYGGTLDVVTGELVVDRAMWTGNTADMDNNNDYPGWQNAGIKEIVGEGLNEGLYSAVSNISPAITSGHWAIGANTRGSSGSGTLLLNRNYFGKNQTEWQALAVDVQIVITLATPQTYQLTPQEVETLLGVNNIWADTGDTSSTYKADTKRYIDNKITQAIANALNG